MTIHGVSHVQFAAISFFFFLREICFGGVLARGVMDESSLKVTQGLGSTAFNQHVQRRSKSTCAKLNPAQPLNKQVHGQGNALLGEHCEMNKHTFGSIFGISAGHVTGSKFGVAAGCRGYQYCGGGSITSVHLAPEVPQQLQAQLENDARSRVLEKRSWLSSVLHVQSNRWMRPFPCHQAL